MYQVSTGTIGHTADASFRAWAQRVHDVLVAATCLTQTSDTGQVNLTTMTRPSAGTMAGYEIFRFNDALQATAPIFIRIEYGTGGSATYPGISFSVGTATNGAGVISSPILSNGYLPNSMSGSGSSAPATEIFVSADAHGFMLGLSQFSASSATDMGFLGVERACEADGTARADGLLIVTSRGITTYRAALFASPTLFTEGVPFNLPASMKGTGAYSSDAAISITSDALVAPVMPFVVMVHGAKTWMSRLLACVANTDGPAGDFIDVDLFGVTETYRVIRNTPGSTSIASRLGSGATLGFNALVRWEA